MRNRTPWLIRAFQDRYSRLPVCDKELVHINDLLHQNPEIVESGEWFALRVRHFFDIARNHFVNSKLEVARPPKGSQFLCGDAPALTVATRNGQFFARVPLLEAGTIVLPIGPDHAISLGKGEDKWLDLDEAYVQRFNQMQACEALTWVFYHPSSGLKEFVDQIRPVEA